jgi:hypothetical protein
MRLPLIALIVAATATPLAAQTGTIATMQPPPAPAPRPRPEPSREPSPYYYERFRLRAPYITMDSAARVVEGKYQGWYVDSKQLVYEHFDPVYFINMITAGSTGTRLVVVDADTGEVLNPEVMEVPSDSTSFWRAHHRRHYRPATYP